MKQQPVPKPRDPFVQHLIAKKQGAHGRSYKSLRKREKEALKKADYSDKLDSFSE